MATFRRECVLPAPVEEAFAWHSRPGAFSRLVSPAARFREISHAGGIEDGAENVFDIRVGPIWRRWVASHDGYVENRRFRDTQVSGPLPSWTHTHLFAPIGDGSCRMTDDVEYEMPGGPLGRIASSVAERLMLEPMFRFRHARTRNDLSRHLSSGYRRGLRILVTGGSGFIGSALVPFLTTAGHEVTKLARGRGPGTWDPAGGDLDPAELAAADAVVHLSGEPIAGMWTASKKRRILESRVMSTRLMAERIAAADSPPDVLVVASGISFYGDTGNGKAGEASGKGSGFLADVVEAWEDAASPAVEVGVRVVHLRTGVVLGAGGGVLGKLVPLVRAGLGAIPGNGGQVVSWVALDDLVGIYEWVIQSDVSGPVNAVAPAPVSLENLTRALGHTLRRPVFARIPEVVLRRAMGEASGLLLDSQDVVPGKLLSAGYRFLCPTVDDALSWEIKGVPGNTSAKEAEEVVFGLGDSPSQRGELDGTPDAVQVRPALDEADDPPLQVPEDLPIANCARLDRGSAC